MKTKRIRVSKLIRAEDVINIITEEMKLWERPDLRIARGALGVVLFQILDKNRVKSSDRGLQLNDQISQMLGPVK